jgi:hypothetical protein
MTEVADGGVVLKSEMHTSRGDLEEELELVQSQDFDAVVLEDARESVEEIPDPSLLDRIVEFPFFFIGPIYTDNTPLLAAAHNTGTDLYYTRERNGDVVQGLPTPLPQLVEAVWVVMVLATVVLAGGTGVHLAGSMAGYTGLFTLPIAARVARGQFLDDKNRNKMMANTIREAHDTSGRTLAILGARHTDEVATHLPEDMVEDRAELAYPLKSWRGLREIVPKLALVLYLITSVWLGLVLLSSKLVVPLLAVLL